MRLLLYKHKSVMKRILFMIILGLGGLMPVNRTLAQRAVDLFQAYSWEQASLQAARENKLVLVEVGPIDPKVERGIQTKPDLVNYLQRNVIAIRLNANDTKNSGFQTHLLMYEPPLFAFFYALWRFAGNDKTGGGTSRSFCFKRNTRKGEGTGCSE